jgi:hypothetical protein
MWIVTIFLRSSGLILSHWLVTLALARELNTLQSLVEANQKHLLEAWHEFFGNSGR